MNSNENDEEHRGLNFENVVPTKGKNTKSRKHGKAKKEKSRKVVKVSNMI